MGATTPPLGCCTAMRWVGAAVLATLVLVAPAAAEPVPTPPPPIAAVPVAPAFPSSCYVNVRLFRSFRTGLIDYCRDSLRYVPGALDCYQFTDQVCMVYFPGSASFTETRSLLHATPFRCPDGPEPPVCPRMTVRGTPPVR